MQIRWIDDEVTYDGGPLRSHWILRRTGIVGDALVAFRGPCRLPPAEMADLEDLLAGSEIAGSDMVHFLWEIFDEGDLLLAIHRQRLLGATALEVLRARVPELPGAWRDGDDVFVDGRKLSISIATRSPVSTLIHFAVNVATAGTPVATCGLGELGVDPRDYAVELMRRVAGEQEGIRTARARVRAREESP